MTEDIGTLVKRQVVELAQPGERGVQHSPPGGALATIAEEIGHAYGAVGSLLHYLHANGSDQNAQTVGHWLKQAEPVIVGLERTMNILLGVDRGKVTAGGVIAHAWMLDAAVSVTEDQGLYADPQKIRALGLSWKELPGEFKGRVREEMDKTAPPISSIPDYARLPVERQEAYTRFAELIKCGGRGIEGHIHSSISVPEIWVPSGSLIEATSETAEFRNYAISSAMGGGIEVGRYSSTTCAWSGLQDETPPAGLAMIAEKAIALSHMLGSIELTANAPNDLTVPLARMASSYENIAAAASPALYAIEPVTTTATVRGL